MGTRHSHVTDEELLLHGSGELSAGNEKQMSAHLDCCPDCLSRLKALQSTMAEFSENYLASRDLDLFPSAGRRALLKKRLAELSERNRRPGAAFGWVFPALRGFAPVGLAAAVCLLLAFQIDRRADTTSRTLLSANQREEPDLRLTPGATVPVTVDEVCGGPPSAPVVPVSLKRKVFELYGVTPLKRDVYEVDYLITPELGGATDIRNLWPEPYRDTVWNAHVKDQLEDRLHRMVCHGDVALTTAQRDISTDWIAAYRKYFHADTPISDGSSFDSSRVMRAYPSTLVFTNR